METYDYNKTLLLLCEKTEARQAHWEKRSRDEEFSISFRSGQFVIDKWYYEEEEMYIYSFAIYNAKGDQIYYTNVSLTGTNLYNSIAKLHDAVKRAFYKVDETMRSFAEELEQDGVIGRKSDERIPEDDIPF